ncbi:hypothetical protein AnigIFM56816_003098 [Aspergillus niger]|nr:hypothetical protein AnigIFM56816_003098 [Aspergillus niger]
MAVLIMGCLKGEKYDEGPVQTEEPTEYFLNGATPSTRYMSIYPSDVENPPQTVVCLFSRDTIDICFGDVPAKKRENRTINNQMQCRVRYKVTTTFLTIENQLEFEAKIDNQVIGRLTIDIPYS